MSEDVQLLRLVDLQPRDIIVVRCECGRIVEYREGMLQKLYRVPSDTLVCDLRFRLRCRHCNARGDVKISIVDGSTRWDSSVPTVGTIVVKRGIGTALHELGQRIGLTDEQCGSIGRRS